MAKNKWPEFNLIVTPSIENEGSNVLVTESSPEASKEILKAEPKLVVGATAEVKTEEGATAAVTEVAGKEESASEVFWSLLGRVGYLVW